MKETIQAFLKNRKKQKFLILGSALCILPIWITLLRDGTPGFVHYALMAVGLLLFLLDRQLKPWELDNAERQRKKAEEQAAAARAQKREE